MHAFILIAAGFDWLESLLPFLFVAFWIVSQVFSVFRRLAGGGKEPPGKPVVVVQKRPRPAPPAARGPEDDLKQQIEEFLRTAGSRRPVETAADRNRGQTTPPPAPVRPVVAKPAAASGQPAASLRPGSDRHVGSLDEKSTDVARHVRDVFSHEISHIPAGPAGTGVAGAGTAASRERKPVNATAAELVEAFRDPATIRRAILLREVIERPVDRW